MIELSHYQLIRLMCIECGYYFLTDINYLEDLCPDYQKDKTHTTTYQTHREKLAERQDQIASFPIQPKFL